MNAKIKAKWIKALRSGKYKQGREALCRKVEGETRYCCLGVLAKVAGFKLVPHDADSCEYGLPSVGGYINTSTFPFQYADQVGITGENLSEAIDRNDGGASGFKRRQNFEQIANWIEKKL